MAINRFELVNMTDADIASAIASGKIKDLSDSDWRYLNETHPEALKIYAVMLGVLGIMKF
jgi:hypothetical protein